MRRPAVIIGVKKWVVVSTAVVALGAWAVQPFAAWLGRPQVTVSAPRPAPHRCVDEAAKKESYHKMNCDPDQRMVDHGDWIWCECRFPEPKERP